jgi:hypothetical protein
MKEGRERYLTMEDHWIPTTCPFCRQMAIGHGWLFTDRPPASLAEPKRGAVGEVFMHDGSDDCVALARSYRTDSAPLVAPRDPQLEATE